MNTRVTHPDLVAALVKPGSAILRTLTPEKAHLLHMASKLCSEAGELMDAIGKHVYYDQPLDINNCREELGDMEFYMEGFRNAVRITRQDCLDANIDKLSLRYPNIVYSDHAAKERADKR